MHLDIWGRAPASTAGRAIPGILSAPGNAVVTSNKRDVVDATRGPRAEHGPVWIFDPQQQMHAAASWWWNPLGFVGGNPTRADLLAGLFMSVQRRDHQRSDGYFEPAARSLLGALLLAADAESLPVTRIFHWLMRPTDDTRTDPAERGPRHVRGIRRGPAEPPRGPTLRHLRHRRATGLVPHRPECHRMDHTRRGPPRTEARGVRGPIGPGRPTFSPTKPTGPRHR
ncbi:hypothetical protein ACU686_41645 [Yinghuangia aomiensis]